MNSGLTALGALAAVFLMTQPIHAQQNISPDSGAKMNKERGVMVRPKVTPNRDASGVRGAPATVAVPLSVTECQSLGGKIEGHSGCGTGFTCITVDKSGDIGFAVTGVPPPRCPDFPDL